ncbi:protein Mis18-beta-like [Carassius carassius]|uniref:protein Mis18-beta-like n=1 Tax=Carassius carassius TaxID=217509 RepID=UPI002868C13D|nr:protein Mis18-beta-like [Carassius carassius]
MSDSTLSFHESSYDISPCDSTQTSSIADQLRAVKDGEICVVDYRNCSVLQCMTCNTVLGDSLGICGEVQSLQNIICLKVTEDVRVNKKLEMSLTGHLAFSTYQVLNCAGCQGAVGLVLHSTPGHLSALRNLFCLQKDLINCYMLRSGKCVKASTVNFKYRLMDKDIKELKQDLEAQLKQVKILEGMMKTLCTHSVS